MGDSGVPKTMMARPEAQGRDIRLGMAKVAVATALYCLFHSAVATLTAKNAVARVLGSRARNGLYRPFYILQSLITFSLVAAYAWRQPYRHLYHAEGPLAKLMHAGQLASIVYATWAAAQVGVWRITGLESLSAWLMMPWLRRRCVPREPEAQGPALDAKGRRNNVGPFAWSRHPLNFAPVPIFWLWPRMNTNLLAFNITATVYLVLGSMHEEARLRQTYGDDYEAYLNSDVPFYVPIPNRNALESTEAVIDLSPEPS